MGSPVRWCTDTMKQQHADDADSTGKTSVNRKAAEKLLRCTYDTSPTASAPNDLTIDLIFVVEQRAELDGTVLEHIVDRAGVATTGKWSINPTAHGGATTACHEAKFRMLDNGRATGPLVTWRHFFVDATVRAAPAASPYLSLPALFPIVQRQFGTQKSAASGFRVECPTHGEA